MWGVLRTHAENCINQLKSVCTYIKPVVLTSINYIQVKFLTILFTYLAYDTPGGVQVNFYHRNEWHQINLPKIISHPVMVNAYDYKGKDITHDLIQKGLQYNFYGVNTTPHMLGYNFIRINGIDTDSVFEADQKIVI